MISFNEGTSIEIRNNYKLLLSWSEIDISEAERVGKKVFNDYDLLCAYYIPDGYLKYSAFCVQDRGNFSLAFRVASVVTKINPSVDSNKIFYYMDALCREKFDTESLKVDRKRIMSVIDNVRDGSYSPNPELKKFYWVGVYQNIGRDDKVINEINYQGKASIVVSYNNESVARENVIKIENALAYLMELRTNTFLTLKDIAKVSGVSLSTVKRASPLFKDVIDRHNKSMFDTCNYNNFIKICSIDKINSAIRQFISELELKISQKKVAVKSGLHINTVSGLWYEDLVQESLEEYNNWISNYKNI